MIHDSALARDIGGASDSLLFITKLEAIKLNTPVVVDGRVIDEVVVVHIGEDLCLVPPDLVILDKVPTNAAEGLDAVVAVTHRLQFVTVAIDEACQSILPVALLDLLVEGRLEVLCTMR